MFANKVMEASSITGTGAYQLGTSVGVFNTWRSKFANGSTVFYYATNADGSKWEAGWGTLTYGAPDQISRAVLDSYTGSAVSWAVSDAPIYVYNTADGRALAWLIAGARGSATPSWLPDGVTWIDDSAGIGTRLVDKLKISLSTHIERGRYIAAPGIWVASPRHYWQNKGAASYTIAADDVGSVITFDVTAASRVATLPANNATGIGHGFRVGILAYGNADNGVTLTPNGSDAIDDLAGGSSLSMVTDRIVWVEWDGANSKWRTSLATAVPPFWKNRLMNADFEIDQRNGGSAQTFTAGAAIAYSVDRWYASCSGANITGQRVAGTVGARKAYRFTGAASNSGLLFGQRIEAANIGDLVSRDVTLSLWLKSSSLTSITWTAYYANSADTFSSKTQIATGTITGISSTLAKKSVSFNLGANAANGVAIEFTGGALLAAQTLQFENVQLEAGTRVTDFERLPTAAKLLDCLRYYDKGDNTYSEAYMVAGAWQLNVVTPFRVPMRVTPTATVSLGTIASTTSRGVTSYLALNAAPTNLPFDWTADAEL